MTDITDMTDAQLDALLYGENEETHNFHQGMVALMFAAYKREMLRAGLANMPAAYRVQHMTEKAKLLKRSYQRHMELAANA